MAELAQTFTCKYTRPFVELHMAEDGSVVYIRTDAIQTVRREVCKILYKRAGRLGEGLDGRSYILQPAVWERDAFVD